MVLIFHNFDFRVWQVALSSPFFIVFSYFNPKMEIENGIFLGIKDELIIELEPIQYAVMCDSFSDSITNETESRYFDKYFKYSTDDGFSYTDFIPLTNENLNAIPLNPLVNFHFTVRYVRSGTDKTGELIWNRFDLFCTIDTNILDTLYPAVLSNPNSIFGYIKANDLGWHEYCNNLVQKSFKHYLPKFIERNTDLYYFIKTVCCYLTLFYIHSKKQMNWYNDKFLLLEHLKRQGLYFSGNESLSELQQIANNLLGEFKKRGTILVLQEIKRLLNYKNTDEFLFLLLSNNDCGWFLDVSSPIYRGVERIRLLNKMVEKNGISDLSNYYTFGSGLVIKDDLDNENNSIKVISKVGISNSGIKANNLIPLDKRNITINPLLDYEVSVRVKRLNPNGTVYFGVNFFDENYTLISGKNLYDNNNRNDFLIYTNINPEDKYVKLKGVLFNSNEPLRSQSDSQMSVCSSGFNIKIPTNAVYVYPYLYDVSNTNDEDFRFYDLRVSILNYKPFVSFIENSNYIINELKNNSSYYTDNEVNEIINRYLVPCNSNFVLNG